jgi:phage tail-like protein
MDVNGSRFHLLFGRNDWAQCSVDGTTLEKIWQAKPLKPDTVKLSWDIERQELTLEQRLLKFTAAPGDTFPALSNRRGAAADRYGNWYWIHESEHKISVLSSGTGATTEFWPMPQGKECCQSASSGDQSRHSDFQPLQPPSVSTLQLSGLAVTEDHYLVVGVLNPGSLLIFDLHTGGEPRQLIWPEDAPFAPFDMTAMPGGGVSILDQLHRCYWVLDRNFNVLGPKDTETAVAAAQTEDFHPVDGSSVPGHETSAFPASISLLSSPVALLGPIAIESLPDGTVLILDHDPGQSFSRIYRYCFDTQLPDELTTKAILGLIENDVKSTAKLVGYDIAFVPQHEEGGDLIPDRLYVAAADGNQSFAFHVCQRQDRLELQPIAEYLPMRLFGGKGLVASGASVYYDFADSWIPLVKQMRRRYVPEATLDAPVFDGLDPHCVWHRLMLDAFIPPETSVEVWSRAADNKDDLPLLEWQREPPLYLRGDGSELPFLRSSKVSNGRALKKLKDRDGTWELLFQRARGRFLQIRLHLSGNERKTTRLRALRSYYPRFSYLVNYLPGVYREDEQSASFVDRFLANVEGLYTALEDKIAAVQVLFDVRSAPAETLEWLASWFGVALDPNWDEQRRRLFIRHAMHFFQYRGTIRGLTMALHLALDSHVDESIFEDDPKPGQDIRIVEKYLTRTMPGVIVGDPTGQEGLRAVLPRARWQPDQGRANLNQRYTQFINPSGPPNQPLIPYPIIPPVKEEEVARWQQFSQETLGFVPRAAAIDRHSWQIFLAAGYGNIGSVNKAHKRRYSGFGEIPLPASLPTQSTALQDWLAFAGDPNPAVTPVNRLLWQDFLARRYRRLNALNDAHGTNWTSFKVVSLPNDVPPDGALLRDWYQFEGIVMQMQQSAHRFTVLLPVPPSPVFSVEEHQLRLDLSRRVIELEKPAHTVFDVKFYWAAFRVGEARLELDTLIAEGSRASQLLPGLILNQGFVGQGYLAPPAPEDARDRQVLGRDALRNDPHEEERT